MSDTAIMEEVRAIRRQIAEECGNDLRKITAHVKAERFVSLMNREAGDYTEWRRKHLYTDETVHSLAEKARKTGAMLRDMDKVGV